MSLAMRFAIASTIVIGSAMAFLAFWVGRAIEAGVVQNSGQDAALYIDDFIAPKLQDLATHDTLSARGSAELSQMLVASSLGRHLVAMKIWGRNYSVLFSTSPELLGRVFQPKEKLLAAWRGRVAAALDHLDHEENASERSHGQKNLLEIYLPVRETGSRRVIAVAEVYLAAEALESDIAEARLTTYCTVGILTLAMLAALTGIVREGSTTIHLQQGELTKRVDDLSVLLAENRRLQERITQATARSVDASEKTLRNISADLHDGPAQLIGLSLLKLDSVAPSGPEDDAGNMSAIEDIRSALTDALHDIRNISVGVALPELDKLSPSEVVEDAVRNHERHSGSLVEREIGDLDCAISNAIKICVYRFVQEGLNNALRHAGGIEQRVTVRQEADHLEFSLSDRGKGFDTAVLEQRTTSFGLSGLRDRIESVGGTFAIASSTDRGTRLAARFPIAGGAAVR